MPVIERWWRVTVEGYPDWIADESEARTARRGGYEVAGPYVLEAQQPVMPVLRREDVIDNAVNTLRQHVGEGDEPVDEHWARDVAEELVGRLADELVGAVDRINAALRIVEDHRDSRGNVQMGRGFGSQVIELLRAAAGSQP